MFRHGVMACSMNSGYICDHVLYLHVFASMKWLCTMKSMCLVYSDRVRLNTLRQSKHQQRATQIEIASPHRYPHISFQWSDYNWPMDSSWAECPTLAGLRPYSENPPPKEAAWTWKVGSAGNHHNRALINVPQRVGSINERGNGTLSWNEYYI